MVRCWSDKRSVEVSGLCVSSSGRNMGRVRKWDADTKQCTVQWDGGHRGDYYRIGATTKFDLYCGIAAVDSLIEEMELAQGWRKGDEVAVKASAPSGGKWGGLFKRNVVLKEDSTETKPLTTLFFRRSAVVPEDARISITNIGGVDCKPPVALGALQPHCPHVFKIGEIGHRLVVTNGGDEGDLDGRVRLRFCSSVTIRNHTQLPFVVRVEARAAGLASMMGNIMASDGQKVGTQEHADEDEKVSTTSTTIKSTLAKTFTPDSKLWTLAVEPYSFSQVPLHWFSKFERPCFIKCGDIEQGFPSLGEVLCASAGSGANNKPAESSFSLLFSRFLKFAGDVQWQDVSVGATAPADLGSYVTGQATPTTNKVSCAQDVNIFNVLSFKNKLPVPVVMQLATDPIMLIKASRQVPDDVLEKVFMVKRFRGVNEETSIKETFEKCFSYAPRLKEDRESAKNKGEKTAGGSDDLERYQASYVTHGFRWQTPEEAIDTLLAVTSGAKSSQPGKAVSGPKSSADATAHGMHGSHDHHKGGDDQEVAKEEEDHHEANVHTKVAVDSDAGETEAVMGQNTACFVLGVDEEVTLPYAKRFLWSRMYLPKEAMHCGSLQEQGRLRCRSRVVGGVWCFCRKRLCTAGRYAGTG